MRFNLCLFKSLDFKSCESYVTKCHWSSFFIQNRLWSKVVPLKLLLYLNPVIKIMNFSEKHQLSITQLLNALGARVQIYCTLKSFRAVFGCLTSP